MSRGVENTFQVANNRDGNVWLSIYSWSRRAVVRYVWCRIDAVYVLGFSFGLLCMPSHSTAQVPSFFVLLFILKAFSFLLHVLSYSACGVSFTIAPSQSQFAMKWKTTEEKRTCHCQSTILVFTLVAVFNRFCRLAMLYHQANIK